MKKGTGTVKWFALGFSLAILVASMMYLTIPSNQIIETSTVSAEEGQYSRTLYGVPDIRLDHYRIGEDKYFDYLVSGVVDVGRQNPSSFPLWYSSIVDNPALLLQNPGLVSRVIAVLEKGTYGNDEVIKSLKELLSKSEAVSEEGEEVKIALSTEQMDELQLLLTRAGQTIDFSGEEGTEEVTEPGTETGTEKETETEASVEDEANVNGPSGEDTSVDNSTDSKKDSEEEKSNTEESTNE